MDSRLTRHQTPTGFRWAHDGEFLAPAVDLAQLMQIPRARLSETLSSFGRGEAASGPRCAPVDAQQEVWASGVTYLRSREAREAESNAADVYERVYSAARPELFFKATGFRVVGPGQPIRLRADSKWNVPEPELTLVVNAHDEIVGFTIGDDVSSRDIEGDNPLYLPQAKVFDGSCALGPEIVLCTEQELRDLPIELRILRSSVCVFEGQTSTARIKREMSELVGYLTRELSFPYGVFLMTGTGIVPPDDFTLEAGDDIVIRIGPLQLETPVAGVNA